VSILEAQQACEKIFFIFKMEKKQTNKKDEGGNSMDTSSRILPFLKRYGKGNIRLSFKTPQQLAFLH
jgi:hypothetical protein